MERQLRHQISHNSIHQIYPASASGKMQCNMQSNTSSHASESEAKHTTIVSAAVNYP
jgi:hypothetical protein